MESAKNEERQPVWWFIPLNLNCHVSLTIFLKIEKTKLDGLSWFSKLFLRSLLEHCKCWNVIKSIVRKKVILSHRFKWCKRHRWSEIQSRRGWYQSHTSLFGCIKRTRDNRSSTFTLRWHRYYDSPCGVNKKWLWKALHRLWQWEKQKSYQPSRHHNEWERERCFVFTLFLETTTYLGFPGKANLVDGNFSWKQKNLFSFLQTLASRGNWKNHIFWFWKSFYATCMVTNVETSTWYGTKCSKRG